MFPSQKCKASQVRYRRRACFNGAGMFPSQKLEQDARRILAAPELQWGRDVSIPEITRFSRSRTRRVRLQWGRDVSIPEMNQALAAGTAFFLLQWGRDVSIPEIMPAAVAWAARAS